MPEAELMQERPQYRGRIPRTEQLVHPALAQHVQIIDRVRPGAPIPATIAATFRAASESIEVSCSRTRCATCSYSPTSWASRITGTNPASDTTYSPANLARHTGGAMQQSHLRGGPSAIDM
jgi:hypothetical protein